MYVILIHWTHAISFTMCTYRSNSYIPCRIHKKKMSRLVTAFTIHSPSAFTCGGLSSRARLCPLRRHTHGRHMVVTSQASIEQQVSQKLKEAMKNKDTARLRALRGIRAAFLTALKASGAGDSLPDAEAVAQLRKLAKMRRESIEMFAKGGREDLVEAERFELGVIEGWLPTLAGEEAMREWGREAIEKVGAKGKADLGKVMGMIMKEHREEVDGAVMRKIVSAMLE